VADNLIVNKITPMRDIYWVAGLTDGNLYITIRDNGNVHRECLVCRREKGNAR
jgi:hypothetical protein